MELTSEDYNNLKICCLRVAKLPETNASEMATLLNLGTKLEKMEQEQKQAKEQIEKFKKQIQKDEKATK